MPTTLKRNFVSELDQFLQDFDQAHPHKSASQQAEIDRSLHVAEKRDHVSASTKQKSVLWDKF